MLLCTFTSCSCCLLSCTQNAIRALHIFIVHWMTLFTTGVDAGLCMYFAHFVMTCCRQYSTWKTHFTIITLDIYFTIFILFTQANWPFPSRLIQEKEKWSNICSSFSLRFYSVIWKIVCPHRISFLRIYFEAKQLKSSWLMQLNKKPWTTCNQTVTLSFSQDYGTK